MKSKNDIDFGYLTQNQKTNKRRKFTYNTKPLDESTSQIEGDTPKSDNTYTLKGNYSFGTLHPLNVKEEDKEYSESSQSMNSSRRCSQLLQKFFDEEENN